MIVKETAKEMHRNSMGGRSFERVWCPALCVDSVGASDVSDDKKEVDDDIGCAAMFEYDADRGDGLDACSEGSPAAVECH